MGSRRIDLLQSSLACIWLNWCLVVRREVRWTRECNALDAERITSKRGWQEEEGKAVEQDILQTVQSGLLPGWLMVGENKFTRAGRSALLRSKRWSKGVVCQKNLTIGRDPDKHEDDYSLDQNGNSE
jgi:hypothetical protein